jgi:hypothetical protein
MLKLSVVWYVIDSNGFRLFKQVVSKHLLVAHIGVGRLAQGSTMAFGR